MEEVAFKSVPSMYYKEIKGIKPFTVRIEDNQNDERFIALKKGTPKIIKIINTINGESFKREISDISFMEMAPITNEGLLINVKIWMIAWKNQ